MSDVELNINEKFYNSEMGNSLSEILKTFSTELLCLDDAILWNMASM